MSVRTWRIVGWLLTAAFVVVGVIYLLPGDRDGWRPAFMTLWTLSLAARLGLRLAEGPEPEPSPEPSDQM